LLPKIDGRECVPVRLIPFVNGWWPLSPDKIAEFLGAGEVINGGRQWRISSYARREDGSHHRVLPSRWADIADRLDTLYAEMSGDGRVSERSEAEWERRSIELMPASVFVWRDELVAEYERLYGEHVFLRSRPGAGNVSDMEAEAQLQAFTKSAIEEADRADEGDEDLGRSWKQIPAGTKRVDGDGLLHFETEVPAGQRAFVFEGFEYSNRGQDSPQSPSHALPQTGAVNEMALVSLAQAASGTALVGQPVVVDLPLQDPEAKTGLAGIDPVPASAAQPSQGTPKTWTAERKEQLRAYRKSHGTKEAAAHFGISESRVRALLPSGQPAKKGYSAFNSR
jgi:hypothetical protein